MTSSSSLLRVSQGLDRSPSIRRRLQRRGSGSPGSGGALFELVSSLAFALARRSPRPSVWAPDHRSREERHSCHKRPVLKRCPTRATPALHNSTSCLMPRHLAAPPPLLTSGYMAPNGAVEPAISARSGQPSPRASIRGCNLWLDRGTNRGFHGCDETTNEQS
jgi:hypothetical protein